MVKQHVKWIGIGLGLILLLSISLRFERLDERRARMKANQFDAADYARDFWDNRLPEVLEHSNDAQSLIHLLNNDMDAAIQKGQTLGESRVHAYLMQGTGTIVGQDKKGLIVDLAGSDGGNPTVRIVTALFISGNAIRDASGLVNVSAFSDTMKFNRISSQINRMVVADVIEPFLAQSPERGQKVTFFGAAEVAEEATEQTLFGQANDQKDIHLLSVVPVRLTLE